MRRFDREIRDAEDITEVISRCEVLRLALNGKNVPYVVPVNFGMEPDGMTLYIHGAQAGTKYDLIARDNRASFEMDCLYGLVLDEKDHACTMSYESVIGWGYVEELTGEKEKLYALTRIMEHYHHMDFSIDANVAASTRILCLRIQERTGKRRKKMV